MERRNKETTIASYVLPCYIPDEEIMALTRSAIESFKQVKAELIIADDASLIGGGYLREQADTYIRTQENEGYYSTISRAIKMAKGEIVALCNNDIRVAPNWLEVAKIIMINPKVVSVHFRMIDYDAPMTFGDEVWIKGKERWCSTSFVAVRKKIYKEIGFYDPFFKRGGFGDYDLWHRVRLAGYETAYTNKSCYQHRDSAITNKMHDKNWIQSEKDNMEYFKQKWGDFPNELFSKTFPRQMEKNWKPFP